MEEGGGASDGPQATMIFDDARRQSAVQALVGEAAPKAVQPRGLSRRIPADRVRNATKFAPNKLKLNGPGRLIP